MFLQPFHPWATLFWKHWKLDTKTHLIMERTTKNKKGKTCYFRYWTIRENYMKARSSTKKRSVKKRKSYFRWCQRRKLWNHPGGSICFKLFISSNTQTKWRASARNLSWKDFTPMARCLSPHIHLLHFVQWPAWTIGQADKLPSTTTSPFTSRSHFLYCEFPPISSPTPTIFVTKDLSCNLHFKETYCYVKMEIEFICIVNHCTTRDIISTIPLWSNPLSSLTMFQKSGLGLCLESGLEASSNL